MVNMKSIKRLFYQFDMFCSSELLRYQSQTQYKTLTGGLLSLVIISVVAIGFAKMVGQTFDRSAITSSVITQKHSSPPLYTLQPGNDGMFMMGFSIQSFNFLYQANLTHGSQYFSLKLKIFQFNNSLATTLTSINLEQCTQQHWKMVPEFQAGYDRFGVNAWLCLPLNATLQLQGSFTSVAHSFVGIQVTTCNNATSGNQCASQQDIDALFQKYQNFYLNFYYVNPVINGYQQNFVEYYVQGNDYVLFSSRVGSQAWVYFSDYTVSTDDSILPFSHSLESSGSIVEERVINQPYTISNSSQSRLASVYFAKSQNSFKYARQVQKISAVISYIGGMVGAITAILFLIKSYTDSSLEVAIGLSLFEVKQEEKQKMEEEEEEKEKKFNFFQYARLLAYRLLRFLGLIENSVTQQYLQACQQQAIKQMDIELLLRRIIKLQTCISNAFTPQSLQKIKEDQPITLNSAKKMRQLLLKEDNSDRGEQMKLKDEANLSDMINEQKNENESVISMHKQGDNKSKKTKVNFPSDINKETQQKTFSDVQGINPSKSGIFWTTEKRSNRNKVKPESPLPPVECRMIRYFPKKIGI